jgi:hypothetical protein
MQATLPAPAAAISTADLLNQACYCRSLDIQRLRRELDIGAGLPGLAQSMEQTRPHLFASTAVFLARPMYEVIATTIAAIEQVIALPAYRAQALARAPAIAQCAPGAVGVFMGYDFHLGRNGPQLIEINTNAGGAMLNTVLARAQFACCDVMPAAPRPDALERVFFDMFTAEWRAQRGDAPLGRVLIMDDAPEQQYLAPEFVLFRRMFERFGITADIADAAQLEWREGRLWHAGASVDLVYNRLTDFHLSEPRHQALHDAYAADAVVLTPHPHAHALYADKRNLVTLSDDALLSAWGVPQALRASLRAAIPRTEAVNPQDADQLWERRRQLFFKPVAGYAGKAAYRGDKLTRRVWNEIVVGEFVAQDLMPPGERATQVDGVPTELKFDLRAYVYAGRIQLLAARMYQGQTTNFRTPGGGFAPVMVV